MGLDIFFVEDNALLVTDDEVRNAHHALLLAVLPVIEAALDVWAAWTHVHLSFPYRILLLRDALHKAGFRTDETPDLMRRVQTWTQVQKTLRGQQDGT